MSPTQFLIAGISIVMSIVSVIDANGQTLPDTLSFSVSGTFSKGVAESSNSLLITDNDLTNGYASGANRKDAPAGLATSGPAGASFFQWGRASTSDAYPYASALWFVPLNVTDAVANKDFEIGYLYYRNGAIESSTGASAVGIDLTFTQPKGKSIKTGFTANLINTPNTGTAEQNADIVSLANYNAPISYKDSSGNTYYLEIFFKVDEDTLNTASNTTEFRAYEGGVSRAEMIGRFTTTPNSNMVPEPSALLISLVGVLPLISRRRR